MCWQIEIGVLLEPLLAGVSEQLSYFQPVSHRISIMQFNRPFLIGLCVAKTDSALELGQQIGLKTTYFVSATKTPAQSAGGAGSRKAARRVVICDCWRYRAGLELVTGWKSSFQPPVAAHGRGSGCKPSPKGRLWTVVPKVWAAIWIKKRCRIASRK